MWGEVENETEIIGTLVSARRGKAVIEARRRFEISMREMPCSFRNAVGKVVGVAIIDGEARWRLVESPAEPERPKRPMTSDLLP
jgi:hypothetical protein